MSNSRALLVAVLAQLFVLLLWATPASSVVIDRKELVKQAKAGLESLESDPSRSRSRCRLGGRGFLLSPNSYVSSLGDSETPFQLGDKIAFVAGKPVSTVESLVSVLSTIPPDATVKIGVRRRSGLLEFEVQCEDSLPFYAAQSDIYRAIARTRFDSCLEKLDAFDRRFGRFSFTVNMRWDCSFHGKKMGSSADSAHLLYEYFRLAIAESKWDPETFAQVRGILLLNRQHFAEIGQSALYADLEEQLAAAEASVTTQPAHSAETPSDRVVGRSGTCFFASPDGKAITSYHVVAGATKIVLTGKMGESIEAQVIAGSEATDLAVLQATVRSPHYLSLAPMRSASVGMKVFTYGYPASHLLGTEPKFTDGTVSALSGIGGEQTFLQISVPVQPGNSGGPLVNEQGEVVGIIAAQAAIAPFLRGTGTLPQNVNWAVKAEYAALLAPLPPPQATASSREKAIQWVRDAICYVEAN